MMMKIGGGFFAPASTTMLLLLIFFFIGAQVSDAVLCKDVRASLDGQREKKSCSACATFTCNGVVLGQGCPEDFFSQCPSKAVDYIKYYNPKKSCYSDTQTLYVSGCETQADGEACMQQNMNECLLLIAEGFSKGYGTPDYPFYSGSNGIEEGIWKLTGMILLGWILARFY